VATKLDTRPARTNALTSREMAKLFCAQIVPAAAYFNPEDIRAVLIYLAGENIMWKLQKRMRKGKPPTQTMIVKLSERRLAALNTKELKGVELIFGGLAGGLCTIAEPDEVRKSVQWCADHFDDIYDPPGCVDPHFGEGGA
jgi:hypothetical protein